MIKNLKRNLINIQGSKTAKKIIFESDDWGSIRMPSKTVFNTLQKQNLNPEKDPYLKYDALASAQDMQALFEVLNSVRDKNNNPAILTANAVMGNPDFIKIKENNFQNYFWEPFTTTWQRYAHCQDVEKTWKQGQQENLIRFQCHGREHLNVDQWMKGLQNNDVMLKKAFELEMISISSQPSPLRFGYMEGLDFFSEVERLNKKVILEEALAHFHHYFGFKSKSFIANCYIWDDFVEKVLAENEVQFIQGISNQIKPVLQNSRHTHEYKRHFMGEQNKYGQHYLIRNAFFEPSLERNTDWVSDCLSRIKIAFRWGKPAIIGCHRLNFIGAIHEENRTKNLTRFKILLKEITKNWPEAEFASSDQLFHSPKHDS
jgi:hypothetical protein